MESTSALCNKEAISSFLFFGYIPQLPKNLETKKWAIKKAIDSFTVPASDTEEDLLRKGTRIFRSIFQNIEDAKHIVPLSGGLDSRAILAGLIDAGLKERITTVTFGIPRTFDYDLGNLVAAAAKTNHISIDLNQIEFDTQSLIEMVRKENICGWVFDCFYLRLIPDKFGKEAVYWSGFMGDPLAGSHLLSVDSTTWEQAVSKFAERSRYTKSVDLTAPDFDPVSVLPQRPFLKDKILSYDEQLDFAIRQEGYIRSIVSVSGHDYRFPFLHPDWLKFILNVPRKHREHQYLYKEILKKTYPKLFSLPTKTNYGLALNAPRWKSRLYRLSQAVCRRVFAGRCGYIDPQLCYIDFDRGLWEREDLKTLVYENLQDLKQRDVVDWIDISKIWTDHFWHRGNYANALTLLASLEINLKAHEMRTTR